MFVYVKSEWNRGVAMTQFDLRALYVIVPFSVALLLGCICILKHKIFLWSLKAEDPEDPSTQPKLVVAKKQPNLDAEKYEAPMSDGEAGNRGVESESDSILDPGKGRKSFCA